MLIVVDVLIHGCSGVVAACGLEILIGALFWPFYPQYRTATYREIWRTPDPHDAAAGYFVRSVKPAAFLSALSVVAFVHLVILRTMIEILIEQWQ